MQYPYFTLNQNQYISELFGKNNLGEPHLFDLSQKNKFLWNTDVDNQQEFQIYVDEQMNIHKKKWGIAGYLEKRDSLLRNLPQMIREGRLFHLGIDLIVPLNTKLYAPLKATIAESGYEEGKGNFGGYCLLKHEGDFDTFYSLYGHLNPNKLRQPGTTIEQGQEFAEIGDFKDNGDWFYHTHLQVLTERGYREGFISKGYCTPELLPEIDQICPNPLFLLKY